MPEISVLIPLFGAHSGWGALSAVCAGWLAQDVPCEVIVAVASERPPVVPVNDRIRLIRCDPALASPGPLRNLAACEAAGDLLYLSDADVRPVGTDFLARAVVLAGESVLAQPWQYRLAGPAGPAHGQHWRELASQRCCFICGTADGLVTTCPGERYSWDGDNLLVAPPNDLIEGADPAELHWRSPFHWGGALVSQALFTAVGGYCTNYVGWGCEDDDLLVKLAQLTQVTIAWRADPALRCLHFEHQRPYGTTAFAANQATLAVRMAVGAAAMIENDLLAAAGRTLRD